MQWTEYCQNLSAAVFHAPRQMSRAIKARELAPEIFGPLLSGVVVAVAVASRDKCGAPRDTQISQHPSAFPSALASTDALVMPAIRAARRSK